MKKEDEYWGRYPLHERQRVLTKEEYDYFNEKTLWEEFTGIFTDFVRRVKKYHER